jgi:hypothetical protein
MPGCTLLSRGAAIAGVWRKSNVSPPLPHLYHWRRTGWVAGVKLEIDGS